MDVRDFQFQSTLTRENKQLSSDVLTGQIIAWIRAGHVFYTYANPPALVYVHPCPYCGAAVYEEAERCPHCENYISREDAPSSVPLWIKLTALVCRLTAMMGTSQSSTRRRRASIPRRCRRGR